jgi:hypothetical protein
MKTAKLKTPFGNVVIKYDSLPWSKFDTIKLYAIPAFLAAMIAGLLIAKYYFNIPVGK